MLSIQQLGLEILNNTPKSFYVFGGVEYGIKRKYIEHLAKYYNGNLVESPSMTDLINLMSVKHIIPLVPSVYVVRYDDCFVSQINDTLAKKLRSAKIVGTIVCVYEDARSISKLNKFFPENVASIDAVSKSMLSKYLHADYPKLDTRYICLAANIADNYGHAQCICRSLSYCEDSVLASMSDIELATLFGKEIEYTEKQLKVAIASRNFAAVLTCMPSYIGKLDSMIYSFLSVAIELDKIFDSKWSESTLSEFAKLWTRQDIYNLFMQTFHQLELIRSVSANAENCIYFLAAILRFQRIPSVEELK